MSKKGLTDEQWDKISQIVRREMAGDYEEMAKRQESVYNDFLEELKDDGFVYIDCLEAEQICKSNPEESKNICLKFYKKATIPHEKAGFVDMLINKKNKDLVPFFMNELYQLDYDSLCHSPLGDFIGNFLMTTADKKYTNDYINLLKNRDDKIRNIWPYITIICGKLKLQEAVQPMLDIIDEKDMTGFVLDALNKYKNPEFLPIFKKYENDEVTRYRNAAKKGIKTIEKVLKKENK